MNCSEKGCLGSINLQENVILRTGCEHFSVFHACDTCGRVHDRDGIAIVNRPGDKVYQVDGTLLVKKTLNYRE